MNKLKHQQKTEDKEEQVEIEILASCSLSYIVGSVRQRGRKSNKRKRGGGGLR